MPTYYETLNIPETASSDVVTAAYEALSAAWDPEVNNDSIESKRQITAINLAYRILSKPQTRAVYDRKLQEEREANISTLRMDGRRKNPTKSFVTEPSKPPSTTAQNTPLGGFFGFMLSNLKGTLVVVVLLILAVFTVIDNAKPKRSYASTPIPSQSYPNVDRRPIYVRPTYTPVGTSWPTYAAYVPGYKIQAQGGLSTVEIDNTQNSSDVFLKLVYLTQTEWIPARMCFIPARSKFKFYEVYEGRYDVRYQDLDTGLVSKTEEFVLEERTSYSGTTYSNITMTLYKVAHGNMKTEVIDESEF